MISALFFAMLIAGSAIAADDVIVRTSVDPNEAWVGQRTLLNVEVLGADGWAQIRDFGPIDVPGAYVMRTDSQGVRLSETIGRTSYTGQRYQLSVYCQRAGRIEIPPLPVTVVVKQWGVNAAETPHEQMTPAVSLTCKIPPGAEGLRDLVTTTNLETSQKWSSQPQTAAPGDAVTRTVTMTAGDVSGMAFPPMHHPEIDGVGVYPGQPSVDDTADRGQLRGRREDSVTYVFEAPGDVVLPDVVVNWWNPASRRLQRIELPGLELEVIGELAPVEIDPVPTAEPVENPADSLRIVLLAIPIIGFAVWLAGRLWRRSAEWRAARRDAEPARFRRVRSAIRGGDPLAISAAIAAWLDRLDPGARPARLDLFLRDHGDDRSRAAAENLARCLASGDKVSEGRELGRSLSKARKRYLRSLRNQQKAASVLPELNTPER